MFGHTFYHGSIKRYISLFGTLFNEIYINRMTSAGVLQSTMRVPITYGPKDKVLVRNEQDPNLNRPFSVILPAISFELTNFVYNNDRKKNTLLRTFGIDDNKDILKNVYSPVPYDLFFTLNIMVKNAEDGAKILEQILPFFTPDWTTTIAIIDDPLTIIDVPTVLQSVESEDSWEGNFTERRVLTWTLKFKMHAMLYGPINRDKIIKKVKGRLAYTRRSLDNLEGTYDDRYIEAEVVTTPGLTSNGQPTSNSSLTIPYSQIDWDDDYGFVVVTDTDL